MKIKINRAPVLTLWATVVAERLGFDEESALTTDSPGPTPRAPSAQSTGSES